MFCYVTTTLSTLLLQQHIFNRIKITAVFGTFKLCIKVTLQVGSFLVYHCGIFLSCQNWFKPVNPVVALFSIWSKNWNEGMNKPQTWIKLNSVEFLFTKITYHIGTSENICTEIFLLIRFLLEVISKPI